MTICTYFFKLFQFFSICTNLGHKHLYGNNLFRQAICHLAPKHIGAHVGALLLGHRAAGQSDPGNLGHVTCHHHGDGDRLTWTHCCRGTDTQACLGTLWHKLGHCWGRRPEGTEEHCCLGTLEHCCLKHWHSMTRIIEKLTWRLSDIVVSEWFCIAVGG